MSTVLSFTDVPEGQSPEEYIQESDKKKQEEEEIRLKEEQKKLDELTANSKGGTEQMLARLMNSFDKELLDQFQIICSRVRWIDPDKKSILWLHDLPGDPESEHLQDPNSRARFDAIVCVSDWQMQQYNNYLGLPYSQSMVIKNAIEPIDIEEKEYDGQVRLIYHTTPHRGLELLVPVFEQLYQSPEYRGKIELDVFSSFSIYGWDQRDAPYQELFDRCNNHEAITYHGYQPREVVIEALKKSHVFAFPSTWPETSCLSAIEAMSARNIVVCPNLAALPETTSPFSYMYQYSEEANDHASRFGNVLAQVVSEFLDEKTRQSMIDSTKSQKVFVDSVYDWKARVSQWNTLMRSIISENSNVNN